MAWSQSLNLAVPDGADSPTEGDDCIRNLKAALQERLDVDHMFD